MKKTIAIAFLFAITGLSVYAQEKGVDTQNGRIRDTATGRGPANNGAKQDVGAGRGIDFGRGKTSAPSLIPNPYRFAARRDAIMQAIETLMHDRKLLVDPAASKMDEGILISQPYTFIKGAVVTESELANYADVPAANSRGWTRARYTILVEVQPIDGLNSNVSVNSKIEGRTDGASGAEWVTLRSTGQAEQEFLGALIEKVTGAAPSITP